jgi:hypothetical protein
VAPGISLVVPTLTSGSRALVHNRQPVLRALLTQSSGSPIDTTTIALSWKGVARSTARFNRGVVEWEVDSASRLAVGDSGLISVTACASGAQCTTVNRYAVLANDSTPVIGLTGTPLEALGAGFKAPFGPGLSIAGADVETGFATVPYVAKGAPRSAGLVYSTRQSYPRVLVPVNVELPWPSGTPTSVKVVLKDGSVAHPEVVDCRGHRDVRDHGQDLHRFSRDGGGRSARHPLRIGVVANRGHRAGGERS